MSRFIFKKIKELRAEFQKGVANPKETAFYQKIFSVTEGHIKSHFSNFSWLFVGRFFTGLFSTIVTIYINRYLGPENVGILAYAKGLVFLLYPICGMGMDEILIKEFSIEKDKHYEIIGSGYTLKVCGVVISFLALSLVLFITSGDSYIVIIVYITASELIFQTSSIIEFYFKAQLLSKYVVSIQLVSFAIVTFCNIVLVIKKASLIFFPIVTSLYALLIGIGLVLSYMHIGYSILQWRFHRKLAQDLFKKSFFLLLSSFGINFYMKIDQVMIKLMLGNTASGNYAVAVTLSEFILIVPILLSTTLLPSLARSYEKSIEEYTQKLTWVMGTFFWGFLTISISIALFSEKIISGLFGGKYTIAHQALTILVFTGILVSMRHIYRQKFIFDGTTKIAFYGSFGGAVVNVVLNFFLIPLFGIRGAAMTTFISQIFIIILQSILFDNTIGRLYVHSICIFFKKGR